MIGITITQQIKDQNELPNAVGSIMTRGEYPNAWFGSERVVGGYQFRTDLHESDGWRDVVQPTIGENQRRGAIFFDEPENVFTYQVIDLTPEEIAARIESQSEANKEVKIQEKLRVQVETELQESTDANEQLENIDVFPLWSGDSVSYAVDFKVKFVDELELKLYRVVQAHTSQPNWSPPQVPALFTRVAAEGEVLVWVQPLGSSDAYQIGDIVWYPDVDTDKWISTAANNVWQPGVFGWEIFNG